MRSRKFLFAAAVLALGLITDQCYARGGLFSLFGRRTPGASVSNGETCGEKPHPAVARMWIQSRNGAKSVGGTAVLIYKGAKRAIAATVAHCVDEMDRSDEIILEFSNGEEFKCTIIGRDSADDLAILGLDCPSAEPMPIFVGHPQKGERSTIAGYGSGCYRSLSGTVRGYLSVKGAPSVRIQVTGIARLGDSGGAILNGDGELIGILQAMYDNPRKPNYNTTIGAASGTICQFLGGDFKLPWKRDRDAEDDVPETDFGNSPKPESTEDDRLIAPLPDGSLLDDASGNEEIEQQTSPPSVADIVARELLRNVRESIDELDRTVSDANIRAAERAQLFADGQRMIQDGLTDETIDAAAASAQPILVRWFEGMGVSGWIAVVVVGILLIVLVRWLKTNTADVRSGKTKSVFSQLAAKTPWEGDDALARGIDRRVYDVGVLKVVQVEGEMEADAQASAKPPAVDPAVSMESRIAAAEARVADLEAKGTA